MDRVERRRDNTQILDELRSVKEECHAITVILNGEGAEGGLVSMVNLHDDYIMNARRIWTAIYGIIFSLLVSGLTFSYSYGRMDRNIENMQQKVSSLEQARENYFHTYRQQNRGFIKETPSEEEK